MAFSRLEWLLINFLRTWFCPKSFTDLPEPWVYKLIFKKFLKIFMLVNYLLIMYSLFAYVVRRSVRTIVEEYLEIDGDEIHNVRKSSNQGNSLNSLHTMLSFIGRNTKTGARWMSLRSHAKDRDTVELECREIQTQTEDRLLEPKTKKVEFLLSRRMEEMCDTDSASRLEQEVVGFSRAQLEEEMRSSKSPYSRQQGSQVAYTVYSTRATRSRKSFMDRASAKSFDHCNGHRSKIRRHRTECSLKSKHFPCTTFSEKRGRHSVADVSHKDRGDQNCRVETCSNGYRSSRNCTGIIESKSVFTNCSQVTIRNAPLKESCSDQGSDSSSGTPKVHIEFNLRKHRTGRKCKMTTDAGGKSCTRCGKCITHQEGGRQQKTRRKRKHVTMSAPGGAKCSRKLTRSERQS